MSPTGWRYRFIGDSTTATEPVSTPSPVPTARRSPDPRRRPRRSVAIPRHDSPSTAAGSTQARWCPKSPGRARFAPSGSIDRSPGTGWSSAGNLLRRRACRSSPKGEARPEKPCVIPTPTLGAAAWRCTPEAARCEDQTTGHRPGGDPRRERSRGGRTRRLPPPECTSSFKGRCA